MSEKKNKKDRKSREILEREKELTILIDQDRRIQRSELEYDYLKFVAQFKDWNVKKNDDRDLMKSYMEKIGLKQEKNGADWVFYSNKDIGIKAHFSNFSVGPVRLYRRPELSLEFTGHYFIRENAVIAIRKMLHYLMDNFGAFFKATRVDIRQDIYDVAYPFDYFPNFHEERNKLKWSLRGNPSFNRYNNDFKKQETGFDIRTSRYNMKSYSRQIALREKYRRGEITKEYYKHYKWIYGDRDVQRLEISLKQDACNFFSTLFYEGESSKKDVLELTLANFGRNHQLKDVSSGERKDKCPPDSIFNELFYLDRKDDVKFFKTIFEEKTGLKFSEATFSNRGRSTNEIISMLAKKINEDARGDEIVRERTKHEVFKMITRKVYDFKDVYIDRVERYKRTLDFMNLDMMEMIEASKAIRYTLHAEAG